MNLLRGLVTFVATLVGGELTFAATPREDIAAQAAAAPDYTSPANWAAGPAAAKSGPVDVFYVHPTTFRSAKGEWNQRPGDAVADQWTDESVIVRQGGAFEGCCRVWAPRYRAASFNALQSEAHRDEAFALAYGDVERAFDWFLANVSKGRPFILAGHSQGGKHISDLLEKRIDGTALQTRMVAAYIIGINLAGGEFGPRRFKSVPICAKPAQTGCAVQWNAVMAGSDPTPMLDAYRRFYATRYGTEDGWEPVCVNPVTFDLGKPASLSSQALGAAPGVPGLGPMKPLRAGAVAVKCERGLAIVYLAPGLDLAPGPGGSMHFHDVGLFFADVRANAALRAKAWVLAHRRK
ncbi:DUF3089 domain-containing protein [Novosphingobium sp. AAP83]|uniref:DUF3089 domain-containing protein n=1 Tax=Novosphingobium sp. AAP83 TaxID=1523425 RepID=UPI0009E71527|nr:DUF3089 domain-containing protein [Novosphingobium sp. AAP83]